MASKIHPRGETRTAAPLVWAKVDAETETALAEGLRERPRDPAAQGAQQRQEMEQRVREARQAGNQEGQAAAREEAAREIQALTERVARAVTELAQLRPQLRRQAEADVVKLALAIARRILHRELAVDPESMRGLIQAALENLQSQELCRVSVHPLQEPALRSLLERAGQARAIEVIADASLERGAAVFETTRGNLDASIETQLVEIERGLIDRLRRQS